MIKSSTEMVNRESDEVSATADGKSSAVDVPIKGVFRPWMIVIGLIILAGYQFHFINFTWDDPFITWRYAENLAEGKGLVFNEGEKVEGYSNLLYVLIFALLHKLHIYWGELKLLYPAKIIGSITSIALIWLTIRYAAKLDSFRLLKYPRAAIIIGFLAVSNIFLHMWAMCGMETIFFAFLVLLGNLVLIKGIELNGPGRRRLFIISGLVFFLVSITRADGFIMAGAALLFILSTVCRKKMSFAEGLLVFLAWLIPCLVVLAWRYSYYGDIFPMSYYSKAVGGFEKIRAGGYQWKFGVEQVLGHWILFVLMYLPIFTLRGKVGPAYYLIFCQTLFYQVYVIFSGFDFLWANRFFTHMAPMLQLMLFAAVCEIFRMDISFRCMISEWKTFESSRLRAIGLVLAILAVLGFSGNAGFYKLKHWEFPSGYYTGPCPMWVIPAYYDTGMWMKENLETTDRLAIGDIGAIPYISGVQVLDCFGLADEYIAKLPGDFFYERYDIDYILGEKPGINETPPDYIVLMGYLYHRGTRSLSYVPSADKFHYMIVLWEDKRFLRNYELVKAIDFFLIFKRKGLGRGPEPTEELRRWFAEVDHGQVGQR